MSFELIEEGIYRCTIQWRIALVDIPVSTFLLQTATEHEWILIDAGFDTQVEELVKAIQIKIGDKGKLIHIAITHSHIDHIAALPKLLELYPNCSVLAHANEKPFLVEGKSFTTVNGDTTVYNLSKYLLQSSTVTVDETRMYYVKEGDIFGSTMKCIETHGHTPGSMSYLHIPSSSLMIGDGLMNINGIFNKCPSCTILKPSTCFFASATESLKKIVQLDVKLYFPAHDNECGITKEKIQKFIAEF
ncbi:beta-lactamase-like protein [Globomyces pollinis-pini]|nr:beta-lactamase-like protein [Globomyces pollinis-pini]